LTQGGVKGLLGELGEGVRVVDLGEAWRWGEELESNLGRGSEGLNAQHLAYVIYTSGSTGKPKGVMGPHRATINRLMWMYEKFPFELNEVCCVKSPFGFVDSVWELFGPILNGVPIVLFSTSLSHNIIELTRALEKHRVTRLVLVPSLLRAIIESHTAGLISLPRLRCWILSGEPLSGALSRELLSRREGGRLLNLYGSTENAADVAYYEVKTDPMTFVTPIGRPIANTRIYILDERQEPVPVGVVGELYIGGAGVARGYLNRPELTAERFMKDPFGEGRMYRTGDLGNWQEDGNIEYIGRNDDQVKIRGCRIELGEIEARLMEHGSVREAVVVAREEEGGEKRLVAYYTMAEGEKVGAEELREHLSGALPEYMVPAAYVGLEKLPLTGNGKLDRKALPSPEGDAYAVRRYEAPQTEVEEAVAGIWAEVLKLERVGRHDNFFELGGHSLMILRVLHKMNQKTLEVRPADLFVHPTVASIAAHLQTSFISADMPIQIRRGGTSRPLFLTPGLGGYIYATSLGNHIHPDIPIYALPFESAQDEDRRTIEGMAMRMVQMIRDIQPVGPYRIAGYSYGGILAYEIAGQLIGADQDVAFVGIIDSYINPGQPYNRGDGRSEFNAIDELLRFVTVKRKKTQEDISQSISAIAAKGDFTALFLECRGASLLPERYDHLTPDQMQREVALAFRRRVAAQRYLPQPIPIPIDIFVASGNEAASSEGESQALAQENPVIDYLGWDGILPKDQIRRISVPGTHLSMVEPPNVEVLGSALSRSLLSHQSMNSIPGAPSPVHVLQTGESRETVLICMPGAGANVISFVDLVNCLDKSAPVYGMQPRGLDESHGIAGPHSTVEAAAATYLNAARQITGIRPVHLLGHSFGGWVAFEMALSLKEHGRPPAAVTILDVDAPDSAESGLREYNMTEILMTWIETLELILERPLGILPADLELLNEAGQRQLLHDVLIREGLFPKRSTPDVLRGPLRTFAAAVRTRYTPRSTYSGAVRLLLADDPRLDRNSNESARRVREEAWRAWAPKLNCVHVPGNHITVLKRPHVQTLAGVLMD
jgi:amino acid adenylation domain-containing protein